MKKNKIGLLYSTPITLWLVIFFFIPMFIVFICSFLKKDTYGGVQFQLALENFRIFTTKAFYNIVVDTLYISVLVTIFTVLLAVPTAYYIARSKYKRELLFLIIIPFWTNFLIRIYAWMSILGTEGIVNNLLLKFGIIDEPLKMLYNTSAIVIISVYTSLPFAILPLYAVVEKFDFSLIEAARDLGATNREAFFKIFLPNIRGGILTAVIFTFIPALGSYAIPSLVGGPDVNMLGSTIARYLTKVRDWPTASIMSSALILATLLILLLTTFIKKIIDKREEKEEGNNE